MPYFYTIICLSAFSFSVHAQSRLYVDKSNGSDLNSGLSWGDAFENLQQALNVFNDDDTIWVAQGIYYPDEGGTAVNDDRTSSFYLFKGVNVYGGFQGQETSLMQRNITQFPTILSGDLQQNDGPAFTNNGDNAYHVLTCANQTKIPTIDGFTITGGNANLLSGTNSAGAGMYNLNADPRIIHCRFEANSAISTGGGMVNATAKTYIDSCQFIGNQGINGGGMYNLVADVKLLHSEFVENTSALGAGIFNYTSILQSEGCVFDKNVADTGSPNTTSSGGGIYNFLSSRAILINNCFLGNYAEFGGGLHNTNSVVHCHNNLFLGNHANLGGGLYTTGDTTILLNCTFTGNRANNSGGAIRNHNTSPVLTNTLIWNNTDQTGVGTASASMSTIGGIPIMTYCMIQNVTVDLGGNLDGMTNAVESNYPQFVTPVDPITAPTNLGNPRIYQTSVAVNVGNNAIVATQRDHDGHNRINGIVDFGAFENPAAGCVDHLILSPAYSPLQGDYSAKLSISSVDAVNILPGAQVSLSAPSVDLNSHFSVDLTSGLTILQTGCQP